jgi:hypothetical protein
MNNWHTCRALRTEAEKEQPSLQQTPGGDAVAQQSEQEDGEGNKRQRVQ